jgi:Undecaprenyl-phosphate glucose phosphotransferase
MSQSSFEFGSAGASMEERSETSCGAGADKLGERLSLHNIAAFFVVADGAALVFAGVLLEAGIGKYRNTDPYLSDWQFWAISFAICGHFLFARILNVYSTKTIYLGAQVISRLLPSLLMTFMVMVLVAIATKTAGNYSPIWFFSWLLSSITLVLLGRAAALLKIRRAIEAGAYFYKALSIGIFCDPLHPKEIQRQTNNETRIAESVRLESINELALLADKIVRDEIDHVYIFALWVDIPTVLRNLSLLRHLSTRVFVLPGDRTAHLKVAGLSLMGDRPMICAIEEPIHGWWLWLKRMEDIVLAGAAVVTLSPLLALVALAIRLDSPGSIIFRQDRMGFNGKIFKLWKFRSMFLEATDLHAKVQTSRRDPRTTRVGRFIRRTSIDELPQLFNVLQGTMSIVGPRPHALSTRAEGRNLEELVDYYAVRHRVRPGMTGWAQIHGLRGELDSIEKLQNRVDYDIDYIDNWSLWLDIKIIFNTMLIVFHDPNAY